MAFREFFALFPGIDIEASLAAKDVLDFGSGYGGKTVDYSRISGARSVVGVEPFDKPIASSRRYAASLGASSVSFEVCGSKTVPFGDESFDVVVSYDVLEHVESPPDSIREIFRVLRPRGKAFLAFPVYLGAASHHLDYVTSLPGLHWIFSADTLIRAVNSILGDDPSRFTTNLQPPAGNSFDGRSAVLPSLNGLGGRHLRHLFEPFNVLYFRRRVLGHRIPVARVVIGLFANAPVPIFLKDAVTGGISVVLEKPPASSRPASTL